MAERVHKRLNSSGEGAKPNWMTKVGDGPTRAITHGHNAGHYVDLSTKARECGPQEQAHHAEATQQQTKSYFTGHSNKREDHDDD